MDAEKRAGLQYMVEMVGSLLLLIAATWLGRQGLGPVVSLAPIVPIWLLLWASIRYYFRLDEYQRLKYLQAVALSAGILFCLEWSYPYLQGVLGLPQRPPGASLHFAIIFVIVTFVAAMRGKRAA